MERKMEIQNIKKRKIDRKTVILTVRITESESKWLKENEFSPSGLFREALLDLKEQVKK